MSSYINFYLKVEDKYCPLWNYSRNSSEYYFFKSAVPYGEIKPITLESLKGIKEDINFAIKNVEEHIENNYIKIDMIKTFNNSVEDKINQINDYLEFIEEEKETLKDYTDCINFVYRLIDMLDSIEYDPYAEKHGITKDNYLWVGIEAGPNEDIK